MTHADDTATVREIGRTLRVVRMGQRHSVYGIAVRSNISTATVQAIEDGYSDVPISTLLRYARALGCRLTLSADGGA